MTKVCPATFYHGTLDFYLNDIKRIGLGNKSINIESNSLELLEILYSKYQINKKNSEIIMNMGVLGQLEYVIETSLDDSYAFRQGSLFVTTSRNRAISYAKRGPEIYHFIFQLIEILEYLNFNFMPIIRSNDVFFNFYLNRKSFNPILIELKGIKYSSLKYEDKGEYLDEKSINKMENIFDFNSDEYKGEFYELNLSIMKDQKNYDKSMKKSINEKYRDFMFELYPESYEISPTENLKDKMKVTELNLPDEELIKEESYLRKDKNFIF